MAKNISEVGIATGQTIFATHVLQITDALRGDDAYNLHLSGNIQINNNLHPTGSGNPDDIMISNGAGVLRLGPNSASYVSSSNVDGPLGMDSVLSASYALTASYIDEVFTERFDFVNQTSVIANHNFGSEDIIVQVYDNTGAVPVMIQPSTVQITDQDNATVTFTAPTTGYIVITRGGILTAGLIENAISASYAVTASHVVGITTQRYETTFGPAISATFTHNLKNKYVVVSTYNTADQQIIPTRVEPKDENNVFVQFSSPTSGTVVVLS